MIGFPSREIAGIVGRGEELGYCAVTFDYGGFIVDGGHKTILKHHFLPSSAS